MIVVDVEATGTEPHKHGLLSIGAVDLNRPDRRFYQECYIEEGIHVMPEALTVNGFTESDIHDKKKLSEFEIVTNFIAWALESDDHTIAGQNPSFDRDFIHVGALRHHINWPLAHRTVDLHSVCIAHMFARGTQFPTEKKRSALTSDAIFEYVGLTSEPHPHNALTGALMETEAFGRLFWNKKVLSEFEQYEIPEWESREQRLENGD